MYEDLSITIIENMNKIKGMSKTEVFVLLGGNCRIAFVVEQLLEKLILLDGVISIELFKTRRRNYRYVDTLLAISRNMQSFNTSYHDMIRDVIDIINMNIINI